MFPRLRRFLDVRPGEGLPVLLTFLYIAAVVASYLLAKPIRNGLFLRAVRPVLARLRLRRGPGRPVDLRAAVQPRGRPDRVAPGNRVARCCSSRRTFCCSGTPSDSSRFELLPAIFYVWVNCFGIIAPVQAWSFTNSLFDTRQAKRLFGLIGAGASLGAIAGGLLARLPGRAGRRHGEPAARARRAHSVGGGHRRVRQHADPAASAVAAGTAARASRWPMRSGRSHRSPYLRLMAALVFLVADRRRSGRAFQLSLVAERNASSETPTALTKFFGHLQRRAGHDQLSAPAARDRARAAPVRHRRHGPRSCRCRSGSGRR